MVCGGEVLTKSDGANASHPENTDDDEAAIRSNTNADGDDVVMAGREREFPCDGGWVI